MKRKINPLPNIVGNEPEAMHGDFLDGLMHDLDREAGSQLPTPPQTLEISTPGTGQSEISTPASEGETND